MITDVNGSNSKNRTQKTDTSFSDHDYKRDNYNSAYSVIFLLN